MSGRGPRTLLTACKSGLPPRRDFCCNIGRRDVQEPQRRARTPQGSTSSVPNLDEEPIEMQGTESDPVEISSGSSAASHDPIIHFAYVGITHSDDDWPSSPIPVPVNLEYQRTRLYDMLLNRLSVHKVLCRPTTLTLGIAEDVELHLDRIGVHRFLKKHIPSYAELIYEFYSSVNFHASLTGESDSISSE